MKKVNIEVLQAENDYLSSSLRNIRSQLSIGKKIVSESQKNIGYFFSNSKKELNLTLIPARISEKLLYRFITEEEYKDFINDVVKKSSFDLVEILTNLTIFPPFIKRLENKKKKIGKKYYKNLVKINKYSR